MDLKPCPDCHSTDIDPAGHEAVRGGDRSTGPQCRACGFWSGRADWTPEQNAAGWNEITREGE